MSDEVEQKIQDAISNPQNMGEMTDADSVGTVGSPECGDMVRMWLKFSEKNGEKVIDRASFQSFGCQTAIAVASVATEMLAGKTVEEAKALEATDLSESLGSLPPMKIHCGQMVEGALREALEADDKEKTSDETKVTTEPPAKTGSSLIESFANPAPAMKRGAIKVVKLED